MRKVLVVDCHDSFVYNLVQLLRESNVATYDIVAIDAIDFYNLSQYSHILLSPGPGLPSDYPSLTQLIQKTYVTHSLLGICLGMQAIAVYFGCRLQQLSLPQHGHESFLRIIHHKDLFQGVAQQSSIGRYHSWIVVSDTVHSPLLVTAVDEEEHIMAIRHHQFPVFGVQFHPESIITHEGAKIIRDWLLAF